MKQISLFVENKPGAINAPCELLAKHNISISTLSMADTKFFGVLRMLVEDWKTAASILEQAGFAVKLTDVVAIEVAHEAGSLSRILSVLDKYNVNVEYMYAFAAGYHGKAALIFRFDDPEDAVSKINKELHVMEAGELFRKD